MAQFARPIADLVAWATGTFEDIDEVTPSDADLVQSDVAPANDPAGYDLGTVEDPLVSTGHILRYRYQKDAAAGAQIDLTVQLRQGYVNEATPGTLIASFLHTNIGNGFVQANQTLGGADADAITDYANLQLRFLANQV